MKTVAFALFACLVPFCGAKASPVAWDVFQLTSSEFRGTGADRTWFGTFSTGGEKTVGEAGVVVDFYVSFVVARTATPATAVISPDTDLLELDGPESNWILLRRRRRPGEAAAPVR